MLTRGQPDIFCEYPDSKYFRLCGLYSFYLLQLLNSALESEKSQRQYVNKRFMVVFQ